MIIRHNLAFAVFPYLVELIEFAPRYSRLAFPLLPLEIQSALAVASWDVPLLKFHSSPVLDNPWILASCSPSVSRASSGKSAEAVFQSLYPRIRDRTSSDSECEMSM